MRPGSYASLHFGGGVKRRTQTPSDVSGYTQAEHFLLHFNFHKVCFWLHHCNIGCICLLLNILCLVPDVPCSCLTMNAMSWWLKYLMVKYQEMASTRYTTSDLFSFYINNYYVLETSFHRCCCWSKVHNGLPVDWSTGLVLQYLLHCLCSKILSTWNNSVILTVSIALMIFWSHQTKCLVVILTSNFCTL